MKITKTNKSLKFSIKYIWNHQIIEHNTIVCEKNDKTGKKTSKAKFTDFICFAGKTRDVKVCHHFFSHTTLSQTITQHIF